MRFCFSATVRLEDEGEVLGSVCHVTLCTMAGSGEQSFEPIKAGAADYVCARLECVAINESFTISIRLDSFFTSLQFLFIFKSIERSQIRLDRTRAAGSALRDHED
jgi:hypothetical protein